MVLENQEEYTRVFMQIFAWIHANSPLYRDVNELACDAITVCRVSEEFQHIAWDISDTFIRNRNLEKLEITWIEDFLEDWYEKGKKYDA